MQLGVYFMRILEKLKKLGYENNGQLPSIIEKYVQDEIHALLVAETQYREFIMNGDKYSTTAEFFCDLFDNAKIHHSGSMIEGASTARCFQKKETGMETMFEYDFMANNFTIPQEFSHLLEPVKDKLGFVCIPFCQELCPPAFRIRYIEILLVNGQSLEHMPKYISPLVMKNSYKDTWEREAPFLPEKFKSVKDHRSASSTETTVEENVQLPNDSCSFDYVPAIRLHFWPHEAAAWITRRRRWWPQKDIINKIAVIGCQVVPRSSPNGDPHSEWRLSFSIPEAFLAQLRSLRQQQAYYFFKMFYYRYLKCVKPCDPQGKSFYSYIIKTIMLWAYEELPPEDPIWASLERSVQFLLSKLLDSLDAGFLSHYFIPEINLLKRVDEDVRRNCIAIINRWQINFSYLFD